MRIPLSEFELHVKPEPLERGLAIFERGQVESIRNLGKGAVEAIVHDAGAIWHPQLTIKDDVATDAQCACGEAPDSICRHGAALIFALQSGEFPEGITTRSGKVAKEKAPAKGRGRPKLEADEPAPKPKKAAAPKKPKPPKTPADILAIVPHEDLKAFVLQQCQTDKDFAVRLKAHFGDLMPATTPGEIKKRIQEMVKAAITVKGKTKKLNETQLTERATEWLREAERFMDNQEYLLSFAVADHLYAEMRELLRNNNFPDAPLWALASNAKQALLKIGDHSLPESMRLEIIANAKAIWEKHYHTIYPSILLASKICKDGEEYDAIEKMMATVLRNYNEAHVKDHLAMIERVKGEAASQAFRKKNADLAYFILAEVDAALAAKDYAAALKAARKGQAKYNSRFEDKIKWTELLDTVYEAMGDKEARIALAISAYHDNVATDRVSLRNIAGLAGPERWVTERKALADPIAVKQSPDVQRLTYLFNLDEDWEGMMHFLRRYKVQRIAILGQVLIKKAPQAFNKFLQAQLEEAFTGKSRLTEWELRDVAVTMMRCSSKDETIAAFKDLGSRIQSSHVLANFLTGIERNLSYYIGYW